MNEEPNSRNNPTASPAPLVFFLSTFKLESMPEMASTALSKCALIA